MGARDRGVGGVVAVHAHPDDETLASGALLAACAAADLPVTVVTCTRGERGEVIGDELAELEGDGPALAARRERELAAALAALGVTDHVFLDQVPPAGERYEDSGMAWLADGRAGAAEELPPGAFVAAPLDEAAARLARVLRDRRPAVVVTYEPDGGYGHPDHVRAHLVTTRAVQLAARAGDDQRRGYTVPVLLWAAQDAAALRAGRAALTLGDEPRTGHRAGPLTVPPADAPLPSVAVDGVRVDAEVDVTPVRAAVLEALRAHATQVQAVRAVDGEAALVGCFALSNLELQPLLPSEGYRLARPADRAALAALEGWPLVARAR
ncbi:PIG-L family deacetylase [Cellulomonas alba]|uniref:PIG-L family deacetylase n=1 Tax=Cellulomonas alba TaxID=3053467 RepID=A0ABT7SJC6_9CELL|nr:PIG-L family deacetylase [Cellulomonas alba]MDM7855659.1 PIG-L family deacetylase [Cellulomonas alba]